MLEKVSQLAEQAAANVSRRHFLGRLGRGAMGVAVGLGGLLAASGAAHAGKKIRICPEGSDPLCVGQPEGASCTFGNDYGSCQFTDGPRNTQVCVCGPEPEPKGKGNEPPEKGE